MSNKPTLFLTGGTGEIGSAIATRFREAGFNVLAPSRVEMDLEKEQTILDWLAILGKQRIDVFIHCAGFNTPKGIADIERNDIEKTMQINAMSFYTLCHGLIRQEHLQSGGAILGISSIYGFLVRKGRFSYAASKHCLNGMVKTLALELGPKNIRANVLAPGFVDTRMTRQNNSAAVIEGFRQKIPLGRLAQPADIAEVAWFLCSSENRYLTGQEIVVDGGYSIGGFEQ